MRARCNRAIAPDKKTKREPDTVAASLKFRPCFAAFTSKCSSGLKSKSLIIPDFNTSLLSFSSIPKGTSSFNVLGKLTSIEYNDPSVLCSFSSSSDIFIFSVSGTLVRTLQKDDNLSSIDWDLKNDFNIPISSGLYVIHIKGMFPEENGQIVEREKIIKWFGALRPIDLDTF